MNTNTIKAKVIECYDNVSCIRYWTAVELYDNGCISPYGIGDGRMFFSFSKENIDSMVKYAMELGYSEVLLDNKVKQRLGL